MSCQSGWDKKVGPQTQFNQFVISQEQLREIGMLRDKMTPEESEEVSRKLSEMTPEEMEEFGRKARELLSRAREIFTRISAISCVVPQEA